MKQSKRLRVVLGVAVVVAASLATALPADAARTCLGRRATIVGTPQRDRLVGTGGADVIVALGGNDHVNARGGNDRVCSGRGGDFVRAGGGNDRVATAGGHDFALGNAGDDRIELGGGVFQLADGGGGNDRIVGAPGGIDLVGYAPAPAAVTVDLAAGTATGWGTDTLVEIDGADGSGHDDTLRGTTGSNFFFGGPGGDTIETRGNDGLLPGSPATVIDAFTFDFAVPDSGLHDAEPGDDTVIGGAGVNVVSFEEAPAGVDANLQTGSATGQGSDTLTDIQVLVGSYFDDTLTGDQNANAFDGLGGTDTIDGRAGQDALTAIDALGATVNLQTGTASGAYTDFSGPPGSTVPFSYSLADIEDVWGGPRADDITGDDTANHFYGRRGADRLNGAGGDDVLDGEVGTDTIDGGAGTDQCINGETVTNCEGPVPMSRSSATGVSSFGWLLTSLRG